MSGRLFTDYFLTEGIKVTDEWKSSVEDVAAFSTFRDVVVERYEALCRSGDPNEAVTEQELIRPVLKLLRWAHYLPQQGAAANEDIPDHLLFADADSKQRAVEKRNAVDRFRNAVAVEESKRFGLSLDHRDKDDKVRGAGTPHGQIRRYLSTADIESEGRIRWGILTNGRIWRLYDHRARPRATGYFEADLETLLKSENVDDLRVFHLLFQRDAFTLSDGATTTFLEAALAEGKRYEERVTQDLSGIVFEHVFPALVEALADKSGESVTDCRNAALVLLYRLLFVLYAEDRGLLPVSDSRYDDYGLRKRVRYDIANRMKDGDTFSAIATNYYDRLVNLFRIIDSGDPSIGLPAYNGGLFAPAATPILERARLSDAEIAPIVYGLSHVMDPQGEYQFVNYRDMSVQQLGSIYERLLEREPVEEDGKVVIRPNPYARKDSGSFYTPQELVDLIVDRTLKPLVEERLKAFEEKAGALKSDRRPKAVRRAQLERVDPAVAVLDLKVLDPAMGSGHFLVTAVDYLSDYVAELIEYVPAVPDWLDGAYESPLVKRVESIRSDIIRKSIELNWVLDEAQLTDQAIIRRIVLKRCIYGVDKNPLTVELAKVSLWLHSFTVGAPLSFLDHHLRCGDSLVGMRVLEGREALARLGGGLFSHRAIQGIKRATDLMLRVEKISDADVAEVRRSATLFQTIQDSTSDLRGLLDFLCAHSLKTGRMGKKERNAFEAPVELTLGVYQKNGYKLLARGPDHVVEGSPKPSDADWSEFRDRWYEAREISHRERFLHWELAFPGVWDDWQKTRPRGGFDAIIGNPPWDQIEQPEVEWFAHRDTKIAGAATAAMRKMLIEEKKRTGDELALQYESVRRRAASMRQFVRSSDQYPLLSGGRVNLYSLFVERAMSMIKPDGIVGLLTPSGIYADKTAAGFFKSISTGGRAGGIFDFENRRIFFKDVHASFRFCALIFGGEERRFDETECAFFLNNTDTIGDSDRCFPLTIADFARVNPNTGTAPIFRSRRDAEITRQIYERHSVLVDRSGDDECQAMPIRFMQGHFNMTSDSHLFRTAEQMKTEGFYPLKGNRWRRGEEHYIPLYEGKMVQAFDHRAASVTNREGNLFRPGQPNRTLDDEYRDVDYAPRPRYWVSQTESPVVRHARWFLAFKDITASTNVRTMIAAAVPQVGCGHTLPVILPSDDRFSAVDSACLLANLNSFGLDYIARQKVQATHLTWFIVEQLPVIATGDYQVRFGEVSARELVRDHVLRLTYTARDMAPFARDFGYDEQPFVWDEEKRRHLRARLDALYFHLYGLSRDDAGYILDTFTIVRREDEKAFGRYRTKEMILAYMNALAAGDTEAEVDV